MRAKELSRLLAHARRHESVRLVSSKEFGRTTLLQELDEALTAQGFTVVRIAGELALSNTRYAALRQSLLPADKPLQLATPSEVRDMITVELSRWPNPVILIDDSEWLDQHSAEALAPLFLRKSISGVFVTPPFQNLTAEQRVVSHVLRADARVELSALSFEQVGVLAQGFLQGNVSPDITSEIFSMSSGITGVAADILRTAQASGQIMFSSGRWVSGRRRLWNADLEEVIERLIAPVGDQALRLLHALSLVGDLTAEQFQSFDPESAESLTRSGLITAFRDPNGESRVSPRPALVADYFRQRPIDLFHVAAVELLAQLTEERPAGAARPSPPNLRIDSHTQHSDTAETHNAGLARFLREQTEQHLIVAAREWRHEQSPARALVYLDTLLQSGAYLSTAADVLEHTAIERATASELLSLAIHERILQQVVPRAGTHHADLLRELHPDHAAALEAYDLYQRFSNEGLTDEVEQWLAHVPGDPVGFGATVAAFIREASGESLGTDMAVAPDNALQIQRLISEQTRLIGLARQAFDTDNLEEHAVDPVSLGPGDDPVPFLVNSYVRSQMLLGLGRVSEARRTLSQALSIGDLDLRYGALYAAMLRWSAFLHHRDGRIDIAQSLLSESYSYASHRGPMPGMRPEFAEALEVLFTGDREAAGKLFLREAQACLDRSFYDATWSMARFSFQLDPSEEALRLIEQISSRPAFQWTTSLIDFARAALNQDPLITTHAARLLRLPEIATAADFLEDVEYAQHNRGQRPSAAYVQAASEARASFQIYREPLSHVVVREAPQQADALTPREREIAPLTATLSNREIAERLTLSIRTVENHIARSMKKLGITTRADLSAAIANTPVGSTTLPPELPGNGLGF